MRADHPLRSTIRRVVGTSCPVCGRRYSVTRGEGSRKRADMIRHGDCRYGSSRVACEAPELLIMMKSLRASISQARVVRSASVGLAE